MKKTTTRIFATLLAVLMLLGTVPAMMLYAAEDDIFVLDFEDETVGEAVAHAPVTANNVDANNTVTIDADPKNPNNKVLKISKTNTKKKPSVLITFPNQTSSFTIEYRVMFDSEGQCAAIVKGGTLQGAYLVSRASADAKGLEHNAGASDWTRLINEAEYKRNEWYSVKINIDVTAYNYDISVTDANGITTTSEDATLRAADITVFDTLDVQFAGNVVGNIYVDNIKVYVPGQEPVEPDPETPVDPDPETPVDPDPETPVDPEPETPVDPEPETPVDPEPETPTPDEPQDTTALQAAIDKVAADLAAAQTALNTAITNGDTALDGKITALNTALEAAKKAYADADTAMQNALNTKIEAADATLDTAIKTVQKNLEDAITNLGAADKTNADAIAKAITDLNTAIDAAEAAAVAADGALSTELNTKIDTADEALQTAIDALTAELQNAKQALENKDKELADKIKSLEDKMAEPVTADETVDPIVIAAIVISCVSICGCGVLAVLYVIGKNKKA